MSAITVRPEPLKEMQPRILVPIEARQFFKRPLLPLRDILASRERCSRTHESLIVGILHFAERLGDPRGPMTAMLHAHQIVPNRCALASLCHRLVSPSFLRRCLK